VPVAETCRILRLSRASYYRHQRALTIVKPEAPEQDASEVALLEKIRELAGKHPFWGYRRITAFLQHKCSLCVNRKRVRRLMRLDGLSVPVKRYKAKRSTERVVGYRHDQVLRTGSRLVVPGGRHRLVHQAGTGLLARAATEDGPLARGTASGR
jgi:hypothetical protein